MRLFNQFICAGQDRFQPLINVTVGDEINVLIRKIQRGLDKDTQGGELTLEGLYPV